MKSISLFAIVILFLLSCNNSANEQTKTVYDSIRIADSTSPASIQTISPHVDSAAKKIKAMPEMAPPFDALDEKDKKNTEKNENESDSRRPRERRPRE